MTTVGDDELVGWSDKSWSSFDRSLAREPQPANLT